MNAYLIKSDPLTLIDTGPNTEFAKNALVEALAAEGVSIVDLYGDITGWDVLLGVSEVCAHLDLLIERGLVREIFVGKLSVSFFEPIE
ncbi:MAG: hypothetical protein KGZ63_00465 [Clostridiales bacterium]|nr:hypothetical protein [Clostridiales bacterium]